MESSASDVTTRSLDHHAREAGIRGHVSLIESGYSAWIYALGDDWIIRVPRSPDAAERQRMLDLAAPAVARLLKPISVPETLIALAPETGLPFGASVITRLPGRPMAAEPVPAAIGSLATILSALHGVTEADDPQFAQVPDRSEVDVRREKAMTTALPFIETSLGGRVWRRVLSWWDDYRNAREHLPFVPSLIHGDLWYGNVMVNDSTPQVTGVLDWEYLAFDDPAQDFATLQHSGDRFSGKVLSIYRALGARDDSTLLERQQWHWEFREFSGLAMAIESEDQPEIEDALNKLRSGPLQQLFEG